VKNPKSKQFHNYKPYGTKVITTLKNFTDYLNLNIAEIIFSLFLQVITLNCGFLNKKKEISEQKI